MAMLNLKYQHCTNADDAFQVVASTLEASKEKLVAQIKQKVQISYQQDTKQIFLLGSGFTLQVSFLPQQLEGDLELSLLLRPFRSKIIQAIEKEISKVV